MACSRFLRRGERCRCCPERPAPTVNPRSEQWPRLPWRYTPQQPQRREISRLGGTRSTTYSAVPQNCRGWSGHRGRGTVAGRLGRDRTLEDGRAGRVSPGAARHRSGTSGRAEEPFLCSEKPGRSIGSAAASSLRSAGHRWPVWRRRGGPPVMRPLKSPRQRRGVAALAAIAFVAGLGVLAQPAALAASGTPGAANETRPYEPGEEGMVGSEAHSRSNSPSRVPSSHVPRPATRPVASNPAAKAFEGLNLKDQRTANNGNQFSLEPPDQALCVGGNSGHRGRQQRLLDPRQDERGTNGADVLRRCSSTTSQRSTALHGATNPYGPFVSDPKCYWDPQLSRFYMTELELGTDSATGDFTGESYIDIAVSRTATPSPTPAIGTSTSSTSRTTAAATRPPGQPAEPSLRTPAVPVSGTSRSSVPTAAVSSSALTSSRSKDRSSTARRSTPSTRPRSPPAPSRCRGSKALPLH